MARDLGSELASLRASAEGLPSVSENAQPLCKSGIAVLVQVSQKWLKSENTQRISFERLYVSFH